MGRRIGSALIPPSRVLQGAPPELLAARLAGRTVGAIDRRGKHLLARLDDGRSLHLHLGMSGRFVPVHPGGLLHVRLALFLEDGGVVSFVDPRMFGRVELDAHDALERRVFAPLGPDAWDRTGVARALARALPSTRRPIKGVLLDQAVLAGLGNIYAAEALWRAKLHPEVAADRLDRPAIGRLSRAIERVLRDGLELLERDQAQLGSVVYLQDAGSENPFVVYGRSGEPCPRCRAPIARTVLGGRATFHCPRCQVLSVVSAPRARRSGRRGSESAGLGRSPTRRGPSATDRR